MFAADAYRDHRSRFVVRSDEKLTAFLELEWPVARSQSVETPSSPVRHPISLDACVAFFGEWSCVKFVRRLPEKHLILFPPGKIEGEGFRSRNRRESHENHLKKTSSVGSRVTDRICTRHSLVGFRYRQMPFKL